MLQYFIGPGWSLLACLINRQDVATLTSRESLEDLAADNVVGDPAAKRQLLFGSVVDSWLDRC